MQTYTYSYRHPGTNRMGPGRRKVGGGVVAEAGHVAFTSPHSEALTLLAECFGSTTLVDGNKGHRQGDINLLEGSQVEGGWQEECGGGGGGGGGGGEITIPSSPSLKKLPCRFKAYKGGSLDRLLLPRCHSSTAQTSAPLLPLPLPLSAALIGGR
ncbi:unnamed protein product [Pleuronectes platessa]|uniref:Uncharacterized protein n=1 Tax=Pleuronectes platessa TaxID=8262 RepID=A0A9N7YKW4_PLEPL|nr:unnamed protein product [Pleuronectes platessa]